MCAASPLLPHVTRAHRPAHLLVAVTERCAACQKPWLCDCGPLPGKASAVAARRRGRQRRAAPPRSAPHRSPCTPASAPPCHSLHPPPPRPRTCGAAAGKGPQAARRCRGCCGSHRGHPSASRLLLLL